MFEGLRSHSRIHDEGGGAMRMMYLRLRTHSRMQDEGRGEAMMNSDRQRTYMFMMFKQHRMMRDEEEEQ